MSHTDTITGIVVDFAEKNGLIALPLYHDEEMWIVHDPETTVERLVMSRLLRIRFSSGTGKPWLSVLASLRMIDNRARTKWVPKVIPIEKRFGVEVSSEDFPSAEFEAVLAKAWEATGEGEGLELICMKLGS